MQRYGTPWQSWINLATVKGHNDPIYAAGYLAAHEILHQLLGFASFEIYGSPYDKYYDHSGGGYGENLNMDGREVTIPSGPSEKLRPAERILPHHIDFLKQVFNF